MSELGLVIGLASLSFTTAMVSSDGEQHPHTRHSSSHRNKNKKEPNGHVGGQVKDQTPPVLPNSMDNIEMISQVANPAGPEDTIVTIERQLSLNSRTFATSNYKRFYDEAKPAPFQHELLHAVNDMLMLFAKRMNPTLDEETVTDGVDTLMKKIQGEAFEHEKALQDDVDAVAEYLWTSAQKHRIVNRMELCSVMNAVIRDDFADEIAAAVMIFRSINQRRVHRVSHGATLDVQSYPPKGETWRGGGFRDEFRPFFQGRKGKKYRVPGFLATSTDKGVAVGFVHKANKDHARAMWRVTFDKRGKHDVKYRVQHMSFVSKTLVEGEDEYLFAPYSVFTLVSIKWGETMKEPHHFTIQAALDNQDEDEDLPLAPWY